MSSNKQYGLILNKKSSSAVSKSNVFNQSDSDSSDDSQSTDWVKKSLQRSSGNSFMKRETKIAMQKALEEDSTVYQYDEVYDQIEQKKSETQKNKEKDRKPKYIGKLLETAEKRKRDNERRIERQVQKEREAEGEQFKDKESFVTSAYKKKLEEFAKLDEEERRQDMLEEIGDVTKQPDISGIYRHLFQSTVSKKEDSKENRKEKSADRDSKDVKGKLEDNKSNSSSDKLKLDHKSKVSDNKTKSNSNEETESKGKTDLVKKDRENRVYRKRKQSESSDGKQDADTSSQSSSSSSSSSGSSSESEHNVTLKGSKGRKRSKSPSPKKSKSSNVSSNKIETNDGKDSKKPEPPKSRASREKEKSESTKAPKKSMPDLSMWQKRTVGAVFDAALARYTERRAARLLSKRKG